MAIDYTQNPYYDDFDETKDFYRLLFRPGYAVQSRELTQIQTVLQKQVDRFGSYVFKNGSIVTGGMTTLNTDSTYYLKLQLTNLTNETIVLSNFLGKFITDTSDLGVRAYVIATDEGLDGNPPTLMVKYLSQTRFNDNQEIQTEDELYRALTVTSGCTGNGSICSIDDGIFFINGIFARVNRQTIILDRYTTVPSYRIGLEIQESIATENQDSTLLDPALGSSNYLAPGAHRYKLEPVLAKRSLDSIDDSAFIELMRLEEGKVLKKIKYPVLSDIENTMARRTYDESGNYTVRAFQISLQDHPTNDAQYNIILEAGKAYVLGYEFETNIPTTIDSDRARDVANVYHYPLTIDYQNHVDVTNLSGQIALDTLAPLDIHCVNVASIDTATTDTVSATKIGTIRIRSLDYQSGANPSSIRSAVWRAYMIDANVGSRTAACAGLGSANTIQLDSDASPIDGAYVGVMLRIVSHAGDLKGEIHQISAYDGTSKMATISDNFIFGSPTNDTIFSLDYELKDAESFVYTTGGTTITTSMDVDEESRFITAADPFEGTYLTDTDFNRSIFQLPNFAVGDSLVVGGSPITNSEYYGRKVYTQTFSSGVLSFTTSTGLVSAVTGVGPLSSPLSSTEAISNILVVTNDGQVINFANSANTVSVVTSGNTSTYTITSPSAGNKTAQVYVKLFLPYSHAIGNVRKSKQKLVANTSLIAVSGPKVVTPGITWYRQSVSQGAQIVFDASKIGTLQIPNAPQSVYTADVIRLAGVYDFGSYTPTTANVAFATDITASYVLDNGQRDNTYDHATIRLLPNHLGPKGSTVVFLDYYEHTGLGYLTVDSYIDAGTAYEDIPVYQSNQSAATYYLRDCIDFRPRRKNADTAGLFEEVLLGVSGTNFLTDFCYYLPRIDKVVLTKDRTFEVLRGVSSLSPVAPADKDNSMTLYVLSLPPYTGKTKDIKIKFIDNRRYTMRDIGKLEQRISNLEYYTTLSQVELQAKNQQITDEMTGLDRVKNGMIVDSFTGHSIGDVSTPDYRCAIDQQAQELRPSFSVQHYPLTIHPAASNHYQQNGMIISLSGTETPFVEQSVASNTINVNPFSVVKFIGQVEINPVSDNWVDTEQKPDLIVNETGDNDAYAALAKAAEQAAPNVFGTVWNNWQTQWAGVTHYDTTRFSTNVFDLNIVGTNRFNVFRDTIATTITTTLTPQLRTGIKTSLSFDTVSRSLGNRVIDTSIVPYCRPKGILFVGSTFQPNTTLYGFFDNVPVQSYLSKTNIIEVNSNSVKYIDTYQQNETVRVFEPSTGRVLARAVVVLNRNNPDSTNVTVANQTSGDGNIANIRIVTSNATYLIGETSGANTQILNYHHYSGTVSTSTSNTVTIENSVLSSTTSGSLVGQQISIVAGKGMGQTRTITAYDAVSKIATVSPVWNQPPSNLDSSIIAIQNQLKFYRGRSWLNFLDQQRLLFLERQYATALRLYAEQYYPDATSQYSIGNFVTDTRGEVCGVFNLPSTTAVRFRTGQRVFRLVDVPSGDLATSSTNGSATYSAQGLLQTTEQTILSTRVPVIHQQSVTDSRVLTSSVVTNSQVVRRELIGGWGDPLAETFMVDQTQYPSGVQITSLRLIFKSKDPSIPVQIQIRPVVNGYPHSSQVLPFADVVVNAEDVNVASLDDMQTRFLNPQLGSPLDDPALYTEFKFRAPVTLQPGQEYAIVVLTNSIKYETYISEMGQPILGTGRLISSQPYLGSFFKSQNSTTWTAEQNQDLMFRLMRAQYDSVTGSVEFVVNAPEPITANVPMDAFYVSSGNLVLPNTSISSYYYTTLATGDVEAYRPFQIENNVLFEDTLGRRMITSDSHSFKVLMYLNTAVPEISPLIDMERLNVLAIENYVGGLGLSTKDVVVTNSTSTFANSNIIVTINGGGGSGANAYAVVANNAVTSIIVDESGSGYTGTPTVTLTGGGGTATAVVVGETSPAGGPAMARYITRQVVLSDGMDAGDLRVYLTAYNPIEAGIYVYYKILSADDPNTFDSADYQLMTCIQGYNNVSLNSTDLKEYVFAPGTDNTPSNRVSYTSSSGSFVSFKYFAIKIVMATSNPTHPPRIKNFRAIALPALSPS